MPGPGGVYTSAEAALADQMAMEKLFVQKVIIPAQVVAAGKTERKAVRQSPTDRGYYRNSWETKRTLKPPSQGPVELINDAPYAGVLEQGARPFWAPIKPLIEWAERKAGALALGGKIKIGPQAFRVDKQGFLRYRGKASLDDYDREEVVAFAYAVRAKIAREGLPALWIMRRLLPYTTRELKKAVDRNIRRLGNLSPRAPGGGA